MAVSKSAQRKLPPSEGVRKKKICPVFTNEAKAAQHAQFEVAGCSLGVTHLGNNITARA